MRYGPGRKEETRARILEAAGKVFRRQGFHAAGVDRVMEEAGLTPGGFYAHFDSKQALLAEALKSSVDSMARKHEAALASLSGDAWLEAFVGRYLSREHRGSMEDGCPLVALVSEVSRADSPVKARFEESIRALRDRLTEHAEAGGSTVDEGRVLSLIALCVGGLGLARSVEDEELSAKILDSCKQAAREILGVGDPPTGDSRSG
ncbi:TetR/AcrR family transcriptional regulator [Tundrisphaera lichenicola]|uniref:TetR/AcrR family transcriptional regulator n=1 Tax=Tundrisphaera lichenicola TaxID=2029860 RepID=UPI003EBDCF33